MRLTLFNTKKTRAFLEMLYAHGHDVHGINRGDMTLVIRPSEDGAVASIRTIRKRDRDGETAVLSGYRQVFSQRSLVCRDPIEITKSGIQKLLKVRKKRWTSLKIYKGKKADNLQIDHRTRESIELSTPTADCVDVPDTAVSRSVSTDQLVSAIRACSLMPPLDSTERGEVYLLADGSSLQIKRRTGEMSCTREIVLSRALESQYAAQIPRELLSAVLKDMSGKSNKVVRVLLPAENEIWIRTTFGWSWFADYARATPLRVVESPKRIAFFSLDEHQLRTLESFAKSASEVSSGNPLLLRVKPHGLQVTGRHPGLIREVTASVRVRQVVAREEVQLTIRSHSLVKLLNAARAAYAAPYSFYLCEDGLLQFRGKEAGCVAEIERTETEIFTGETPTLLWASGGDPKLVVESPHNHILLSFAELPKQVQRKEGEFERRLEKLELLDGKMRIFFDSGAFSVWHAGARVNFDDYIRFLKWNAKFLDTYVALDVIRGTVKENVDQYVRMLDAGLTPLYVWHLYEDFALLDELLQEHHEAIKLGGIGAGGAPLTPDHIREPYICELIGRITTRLETRIHLFGTTSEWILKKYPMVYSADSTSWRFLGQNHQIQTPFGTFSTKPRDRRSILGHRLRDEVQRFIDSLNLSRSVSIESLCEESDHRHLVNLAYWSFFERYYAYVDWMKLEQRFIPGDKLKARGKLNLDNSTIITPTSYDAPHSTENRTAA